MKSIIIALSLTLLTSGAWAAVQVPTATTRLISKITDTYEIKSGKTKLLESEYEIGTFDDQDGLATNVETIIEKQKDKKTTIQNKLDRVIKMAGFEGMKVVTKKVSDEVCTTSVNKKYCSTSIELTF